ncbi:MAG TPA: fimbrial protein, partial [Prevotella sp.]
MKVSLYIHTFMASVLLLTLGSCRADEDVPFTINKEDCYQLQFGLSILPPQTRATEAGVEDPFHENTITSMDAFIYDDAGQQQGHYSTTKGDLVVDKNTDITQGKATIYVPKDNPLSTLYQGHNYDLYVLVNYHGNQSLDNLSLDDLKKVVLTSTDLDQTTVQAQKDFLMDGTMKTGTMTWATQNNYNITTTTGNTLKLARAAAKIRIRLDAKIIIQDNRDIYDVVGEPTITLKSYTNQTSLLAGTPVPTPAYLSIDADQPMVKAAYNGKDFWTRSVPYYSYENDWTVDAKVRTYAVIKLRVRKQGDPDQKVSDSFYSVPLNYMTTKDGMTQDDIAGLTKLQRNHLYDIECSIKQLGSAEPTKPVDLPNGYIAVEDWNTPDAIDAVITKAHYLVVKENHPEMLNVNERLVEYISDLPINVEEMNRSIRHAYTQYERDGSTTPISGGNKDGKIRVDTLSENGKKYLKVT